MAVRAVSNMLIIFVLSLYDLGCHRVALGTHETGRIKLEKICLRLHHIHFQSFTCHESGASALAFAPRRQRIVSAGKRGAVAIWDVRAHRLAHTFKAHDHAVKCLAVDPAEEFFVTGSVAGDIKVKNLSKSHIRCSS